MVNFWPNKWPNKFVFLNYTKVKLGINTNKIFSILNLKNPEITIDSVRNTIKRDIKDYIEFKGSRKVGGYFIKK